MPHVSEPDEDLDDADFGVALDIVDMRFKALELAANEDLLPEGIVTVANYYFNYALTGLIVPYPAPEAPGKKKLKAVT